MVVDNDEDSGQSNPAVVVVNFESIDNPPMLDLNGPQQPGRDNTVTYVEGSDPAMVSGRVQCYEVWVWLESIVHWIILQASFVSPFSFQLVSADVSIFDVDTPTVSSMVITIPALYPGDDYTFPDTPTLTRTIESNGGSRVVTYEGVEPTQTYLDLMLTFTYRSGLDEPGTDNRSLSFEVFTPSDAPGEMLGSNVAWARVQILPLNDNPPVFSQGSYAGSIMENSPPGTPIGVVVSATDSDNSDGTDITFATSDPFFYVDPVEGVVSSLAPLDAELGLTYELYITASDNDGEAGSLTSVVLVQVNITDANDEAPVFNQTLYSTLASEDTPIGATLLTLVATDQDISEANSVIMYTISEGDGPIMPTDLPFEVDLYTGDVMVTATLDFESAVTLYEFTVLGTDTGTPALTSSTRVRVRVTDVNDNAPVFTNTVFSFLVEEDMSPGAIVSIRAQDADSGAGGEIVYTVEGTSMFSIHPTSGLLSLDGQLDFETTRMHVFAVVAIDLGSPRLSSRETITITVQNVNDNPPTFSQDSYTFNVPENSPFLVETGASDLDEDLITYSQVSGFVAGIQLDILSGEISSAPGFTLDFESVDVRELVVEALDGVFNATANVRIVVQDVNDLPPVFPQDIYSVRINESLPLDALVIRVRAEDGDTLANADVEYTLVPEGVFGIDPTTGAVFVAGVLDFDTSPVEYSLNVTARNTVPPYFEDSATLIITLLDVNDFPPLLTLDLPNVTFVENSDPVPLAAELLIEDSDGPDHLLAQCTVSLTRVCMPTEISPCTDAVSVDESLAMELGLSVQSVDDAMEQTLVASGSASESHYQSLLRTLVYGNSRAEPVSGQRSVTVQCQDDDFASNVLEIAVFVQLLNEFCSTVSSSSSHFNFTEEGASLQVGELAQLVFMDEDSRPHDTLRGLTITLSNRLDSPQEFISITDSAGLMVVPVDTAGSGEDMFATTQTLMLRSPRVPQPISVFEQALRSLVYTNTQPEPSTAVRTIAILPMDAPQNCTMVELTVSVLSVNDNPPQLALTLVSALAYVEESGELAFASEAGLTLTDLDDNALFPLQAAIVVLEGILDTDDNEMLRYAESALPAGVEAVSSRNGTLQTISCWNSPLSNIVFLFQQALAQVCILLVRLV